ncbi:MAG: glutathione S-transferase C-terminal domain-containing protein [Burkholderiaceae bacterium]
MIDLYTWPTPNGHKIHIMLEEANLPYAIHPVDIGRGEQFDPSFLTISPNNRIPAIVDQNGPDDRPLSLFESGAILVYLAGKSGRFLPKTDRERFKMLEWVMWQVGGFGPMLGQAHHFRMFTPDKIPYAYDRYTNEANRLYRILNKQLEKTRAFVSGRQYTIADMAVFPWCRSFANQGVDMASYPAVQRWFDAINGRPAVKRALSTLADYRRPVTDDEAREVLFGSRQYAQR